MADKWFDVDKKGLSKLMERRGKEFVVYELIQNAWDQNVTRVDIGLERVESSQFVKVTVTDDDPEGFKNLEHAWTLFAESEKKGNAEKRGRFNLGEKLVLAICKKAEISTTKGTVAFDENGRRVLKTSRDRGSQFMGLIKMTNDELAEVIRAIRRIIPPVPTRLNGEAMMAPCFLKETTTELPTEIGDEEGMLRRSRRKTKVTIYDTRVGETAYLYEMGIPVCETGDKYHIDVGQKVPLNMDRDNVSAAYLTELRTAVLNAMLDHIKPGDLENDKWLRDAAGSDQVAPEAVAKIMDLRFGEKRVIFDPTDPEANKLAVAKGYTVIHGSMMSKSEWENVKENNLAFRAGVVTPSPKAYSENGPPTDVVPRDKWTPDMEYVERYARKLAVDLLGCDIGVLFVRTTNNFAACYGSRELHFNLFRLGHQWFKDAANTDQGEKKLVSLLIHEFGHHFSMDHLSSEFHDALCDLGAKLYMITKK